MLSVQFMILSQMLPTHGKLLTQLEGLEACEKLPLHSDYMCKKWSYFTLLL